MTAPAAPSRDVWTARGLVAAQFVLLGLLALLPSRTDWPVPGWLLAAAVAVAAAGIVIMVLGAFALGRGLTALPLPNDRAQLHTDGLYAHVRHPIYSGLLLAAAALAAVSGSVVRLVVFLLLVGLLAVKAGWEEARLARRFDGYAAYAARTPRFVPRPWRQRRR